MRNLKLTAALKIKNSALSKVKWLCIPFDNDVLYGVKDDEILKINTATCFDDQHAVEVFFKTSQLGCVDDNNKIVDCTFLGEQQSLCVAVSSGDVLLLNVDTKEIDCVGSVEDGLQAMAWSPDQEIVILVSTQGKLILMTRDFYPLSETILHESSYGENQPVVLGWGKKETQFHGSEGKAAAKVAEVKISEVLEWDDKVVRISWRGDGQFFVTSSVAPNANIRQIRMWSREGNLLHTAEQVDGVEQALSWKPTGGLIASTQRRIHKHEVIFYEKNGLRHGEFTLPWKSNQMKVHEVLWDGTSTILALWVENIIKESEETESKHRILLWTCSNYHWQLKQSLDFPAGVKVDTLLWDTINKCRMHITCSEGSYYQYTWSNSVISSFGITKEDKSFTAVINGNEVCLTPLSHVVIPPPMNAYKIVLPESVTHVSFSAQGNSNDALFILSNGNAAIYRYDPNITNDSFDNTVKKGCISSNVNIGSHKCIRMAPVLLENEAFGVMELYQWSFVNEKIAIAACVVNGKSFLVTFTISNEETNPFMKVKSTHVLKRPALLIISCPSCLEGVIELDDGTVLKYEPEQDKLSSWFSSGKELNFPQQCSKVAIFHSPQGSELIGLTDRCSLYLNEFEICNNCTSFEVSDTFLLFTTHQHTLVCWPLQKLSNLVGDKNTKMNFINENSRAVERGSMLVKAVPDDTKVILQMPRGNLETINPRPLTLHTVGKLLDEQKYKTAFELMRKNRINMNIFVDHNPTVFMNNISKLVEQIDDPSWLCLFISELIEEDITTTMYSSAYKFKDRSGITAWKKSKVDSVSDAMKLILEQNDSQKFLLPILTCHAKKSTSELDVALKKIYDLKKLQNGNAVSADEALMYLLYLVDVNELYNVALGTYDFDVVIMVAEKSQKDPKEYLPFLNGLHKMEHNYMCFVIDKHLKRYQKALDNLSKCGDDQFPEFLNFMKEHKLFYQALGLFPASSLQYKEVSKEYGQYLLKDGKYDDAGIIFCRGGYYVEALQACLKSTNWKQIFSIAAQLQFNSEQLAALAHEVSSKLKLPQEAAAVLELYTHDYEEIINLFSNAQSWDDAFRVSYTSNHPEFIESIIRPNALSTAESLQASLEEHEETFNQRCKRLQIVRKLQQERILQGDYCQDSDMFSDTASTVTDSQSSTYSASTGRTTRTSARRRTKEERKKFSLKEGSPYEEMALVFSLQELTGKILKINDESEPLVMCLLQLQEDLFAKAFQSKIDAVLNSVKQAVGDIWPVASRMFLVTSEIAESCTSLAEILRMNERAKNLSLEEAKIFIPPVFPIQIKRQKNILR